MPLPDLRLVGAAVMLAVATPAPAQMNMNMPGMTMPVPKKKSPAKKPSTKKAVSKSPAKATRPTNKSSPASKPSKPTTRPHSSHDMSAMPGMDMPKSGDMSNMSGKKVPPSQDMSTMPGMAMPPGQNMSSMPGMAMPAGGDEAAIAAPSGTDLIAGNAPAPPVPTDHAADPTYGAAAMAIGRQHLNEFHGGQKFGQLFVNLAEYQLRKGRDGFEWNGQAWYGGDIDRLWLKSEGDGTVGRRVERAEAQALYSHAIGPYFNLQGGIRYDFKPNPSRAYATVGVEGLAASFFEVEGEAFLSNKGELLARAEGYYDERITQRLIIQPRAEVNFAAQSSRATGVGSGLSDAELGVRLRYDIRREFAPYVGVQYQRAFAATRRFRREAGEDGGGWSFLAGIHTWF